MEKSHKFEGYKIVAFIVSILVAIVIGIFVWGISSTYSVVGTIAAISFLTYMVKSKSYTAKREELKAKLEAKKAAK